MSTKKKMSKAEKEKLRKEEEDRKRQEEEEARQKVELEEKERLDKEREEAEEKRQLENEERKRRKGQLQELDEKWTTNRSILAVEGTERRKQAKWDRYMLCDGSPDPTVPREINTYMNLWREDQQNFDIDTVLKESKLTLKLIDELGSILGDTPEEEITEAEVASYKEIQRELQMLMQQKLDLASYDLLLKATALADPETMNLQQVVSDGVITLCLWGNLSKNPRIKSFEFEEVGTTFEIPKVLTLSDVAIRIMLCEYDHYSQHCRSNVPRIKKKLDEVPAEEEPKVEEEKKEGEEGEEGEKKEDEEEAKELEREETEDVLKELQELEEDEDDKEKVEEKEEINEPLEEDFEIRTPEPLEWEDFDGDEDVIDLRAYSVMGPIFHLNLLQLPPQPKNVHDWIMTILEDPELTPFDYVVDQGGAPPSAQSNRENESEEGDKKEKREVRPPIGISMKLPPKVYFCEEPQVARWDHANQEWQLEGFSEHTFDEEKKILTFKTANFGVMALLQDSHINMPFQSWELRPRAPNHAFFTVIAAIVELELEIKDGDCCMVIPEDRPELEHFRDQWVPTAVMIKKLKQAGLNVFPEPDSHKYVSVQAKNAIAEERVYQQMALTASAMAFSWSKWNSEVGNSNQIVVQGCEHLEDEPLLEEDWSLFLITKVRTTKLRMTEFDENFSEDHAEGTEFHADLYHMTSDVISNEGKARLADTNYKFIDSIYTLLKSTKVLTYS